MSIAIELANLPLSIIAPAYSKFGGMGRTTKSGACLYLERLIQIGQIKLTDVQTVRAVSSAEMLAIVQGVQFNQVTPAMAAAVSDDARVDKVERLLDATAKVANRAETTAMDAAHVIGQTKTDIVAANAALGLLHDDIKVLREQVRAAGSISIDPVAVQTAIGEAVSVAFGPFEQAVRDAGAEAAVGAMVGAKIINTATALDVFGVDVLDAKGRQMIVDIWDAADAPAIDPMFIWTEGILKHLLLSQRTAENLWFAGDKGTGKSETARQFAAKTGRAFTRINFHKYTTCEDYVGALGLVNGATEFVPGDFLRAFTCPSTVVLLDEITNADPGELATLNGFLEPNSAVHYGGAVRRRAPGVLVFAADNTLANGDESGRYAGTRTMNSALADRFGRMVKFSYLPVAQEVEAIRRHTGCTAKLAEHVIGAITAARAKVETADIVDAPSIRSAIAFIRALDVLSVDDAWDSAIALRQPSESASALAGIKAAYLNADLIKGELA